MSKSTENKTRSLPLQTRVYAADKNNHSIGRTLVNLVKDLPAIHSLGFRLAERSIRTRYRQSVFGFLWAFLPPLSTAILWIILNKSKVVTMADVGAPYPVFVIVGTMLWSVFTNAMLMPMNVMQTNRSILVKINFPREALIIDAFYEVLFNTLISFVIIIVAFLAFKIEFSMEIFLFLPDVFILIVLGMALGLLILPFSFLLRDIQFVLPTILQFAMYLTPVVYAKQLFSGGASFLKLNPVTPLLTHARAALLHTHTFVPLWEMAAVTIGSFILLILGIFLQKKAMQIIIERMGS